MLRQHLGGNHANLQVLQGLRLAPALIPKRSVLCLSYISPETIKTQGKGHKSKVKLYFTVIFSIYKELQYMFMGTPSAGLPSFSLGGSLPADSLLGGERTVMDLG